MTAAPSADDGSARVTAAAPDHVAVAAGGQAAAQRGAGDTDGTERAVPYVCPFCGEEDLRPVEHGRWHCRSCLRVFSVAFYGLHSPEPSRPAPEPGRTR